MIKNNSTPNGERNDSQRKNEEAALPAIEGKDREMIEIAQEYVEEAETFGRFLPLASYLDSEGFDVSRISNKLQSKYSSELGVNNIQAAIVIPQEAVKSVDKKGAVESSEFSTNVGDMDKSEEELRSNKNIGTRSEFGLTVLSVSDADVLNQKYIPSRDDRGRDYVKYDFVGSSDGKKYDIKCVSEESLGGNYVYIKDNRLDMRLKDGLHYTYDNHSRSDWQNVEKFHEKVRKKPNKVDRMINSFHFSMGDGRSLILYTSSVSTREVADTVDSTTYQDNKKYGGFMYPQFNSNGGKNRTIFLTRNFVYDNHLDKDI